MRTCALEGCGKSFQPVSPIQLYCSKKHKNCAAKRRLRAGAPPSGPNGGKPPRKVQVMVRRSPDPAGTPLIKVVESGPGEPVDAKTIALPKGELALELNVGRTRCLITGKPTGHPASPTEGNQAPERKRPSLAA